MPTTIDTEEDCMTFLKRSVDDRKGAKPIC